MDDLISRQAAIEAFGLSEKTRKYGGDHSGYDTRMLYEIQDVLENLPPAEPENKEINYQDCSNAMLRMWIDNVLTDGEYIRIMDKLNAHWVERREE